MRFLQQYGGKVDADNINDKENLTSLNNINKASVNSNNLQMRNDGINQQILRNRQGVDDNVSNNQSMNDNELSSCESDYSDNEYLSSDSLGISESEVYEPESQKGVVFAPPSPYLPLKPYVPNKEKEEADNKVEHNYYAQIGMIQGGLASKHILLDVIKKDIIHEMRRTDLIRRECYEMYSSLPTRPNHSQPVLVRLRRRLLRLAGHIVLTHNRGRHEVIFQTVFLFDVVLCRYAQWLQDFPGCTLKDFLDPIKNKASRNELKNRKNNNAYASKFNDNKLPSRRVSEFSTRSTLSESETRGEMSDNITECTSPGHNNEEIEMLPIKRNSTISMYENVQAMDYVPKEDLRTLLIVCVLLASKWNNSRFVPSSTLCSLAVGRVPHQSVLNFEVSLLSLFQYRIKYSISPLTVVTYHFGVAEDSIGLEEPMKVALYLSIMILILAITQSLTLQYPTDILGYASVYISQNLLTSVFDLDSTYFHPIPTSCMNTPLFHDCVQFLKANIKHELQSSLVTLQRLKQMRQWEDTSDAPNVFGIAIPTKGLGVGLYQANNVNYMGNAVSEDEGRMKTESLGLQYLRKTCALLFDLLTIAVGEEINPDITPENHVCRTRGCSGNPKNCKNFEALKFLVHRNPMEELQSGIDLVNVSNLRSVWDKIK